MLLYAGVTLLLFVSETVKIIVNSHSQSIVLKTDFFDAVCNGFAS